MKASAALILYVAAILVGTTVHDIRFLGLGLAMVLALAGRKWIRVVRKASLAVLMFNAVVTVSYVVIASLAGTFSLNYVLLINLRVLFLTCLTFLFVERINVFQALSFSPSLTSLFTLSYSQAVTFRQVLVNFRMAFKSRSIERVKLRDRYRHSASVGGHLLEKSLHNATEITRVMRSRGFFDD